MCMYETCIFLEGNKDKTEQQASYKWPEASIDIQTNRGTQLGQWTAYWHFSLCRFFAL